MATITMGRLMGEQKEEKPSLFKKLQILNPKHGVYSTTQFAYMKDSPLIDWSEESQREASDPKERK